MRTKRLLAIGITVSFLLGMCACGKNTDNNVTKGTYRDVNNSDLFFEGDSFNIKKYSSVFLGGKMNNGQDFPYEIKVKSISEGTAEITVKPVK